MPDASHLLVFVAAGWLLNLTPGPDILYIVTNSLRGGRQAGLMAGLGITVGCFVHVLAAALGIGALFATSAAAFTLLKWMGATYLVYIGLRILFDRAPEGDSNIVAIAQSLPPKSLFNVFVGGFWTNVLNPKVALFFLAFLPQFIRADAEGKSTAFLLLGILFNLSSVPINIGWAIAAAWMAKRESVQRGMYWLDKTAGCIFICFGIRLVLTERPTP